MADRKQIIDERAAWAEEFRNAPTNAVTRMRRAADMAAAADQETIDDAAAFERSLSRDKGARDLFLGRERLNQAQQRIGQAERGMAQRQANFDATQERMISRDVFDQQMRTNKMELDVLNNQRLMQKELRDAANAKTILDHTIKAERDIDDNIFGGILPGTKEFADIALRTIARFPMMDPKARASILSSAKILGDEEDFDTAWAKLSPEKKARATVVDDPKGWRISVGPEKAPKAAPDKASALHEDMRSLLKMDVKNMSEEDRMYVESEKRRVRRELSGLGSPETSAAPSPVTQSSNAAPKESNTLVIADVIKSGGRALRNPSTGETVFVDKDNNILGRLKSDGAK